MGPPPPPCTENINSVMEVDTQNSERETSLKEAKFHDHHHLHHCHHHHYHTNLQQPKVSDLDLFWISVLADHHVWGGQVTVDKLPMVMVLSIGWDWGNGDENWLWDTLDVAGVSEREREGQDKLAKSKFIHLWGALKPTYIILDKLPSNITSV